MGFISKFFLLFFCFTLNIQVAFAFDIKGHLDQSFRPFGNNEVFQLWTDLKGHAIFSRVEEFKTLFDQVTDPELKARLITYQDRVQESPTPIGFAGGDNLFHYAADVYIRDADPEVTYNPSSEIVTYMCDALAGSPGILQETLEAFNIEARKPIYYALNKGYYDIAAAFIACGTNTGTTIHPSGLNAQMMIVGRGQYDLYQQIRDNLNLNAHDFAGRTLLRWALRGRDSARTPESMQDHFAMIIQDLRNLGVALSGFGCEYFNLSDNTLSTRESFVIIDNDANQWEEIRSEVANADPLTAHNYQLTPYELSQSVLQESLAECERIGYETCVLAPAGLIPPNMQNNPAYEAFALYETLDVDGYISRVVYRKLRAYVSVIGYNSLEEAQSCYQQAFPDTTN